MTPEPLAVGAAGSAPLARHSFLVVREPEGGQSLTDWFSGTRHPTQRRLGLEALGAALARLFTSRAVLPDLGPEDVRVIEADAGGGGGDCAAKELAALGVERGRARRRLPEIVVTEVAGGRLSQGWRPAERQRLLTRFAGELVGAACTWREAARLVLHARGMRSELRGDWRSL